MGISDGEQFLSRIERVCCLGCGSTYVKPSRGGTVSANPGCPECGYVGWAMDATKVNLDAGTTHFAAGRLHRRTG